jgi:nicotinate-nucleotide adenylyltransferase
LKRIGILGGTFNPPHIAHKIAAEFCRDELALDCVVFMPSGNHPLKVSIDPQHRYAMAVLAFERDEHFEVSDLELKVTGEKTFTVNTLRALKDIHGEDTKLVLLIGADNLLELHKWKDPHLLFELAEVAVMHRPGFDLSLADNNFLDKSILVEIPLLEISSTMIRERVARGRSIRFLVDPIVETYIYNNDLYR